MRAANDRGVPKSALYTETLDLCRVRNMCGVCRMVAKKGMEIAGNLRKGLVFPALG